MTYMLIVFAWLRMQGKKREHANLSHLGPSNDIIISIRK